MFTPEMLKEMERKDEEIHTLNEKFQDAFKKLSFIDKEIEVTNDELKHKKQELEEKTQQFISLNEELDRIKSIPDFIVAEIDRIFKNGNRGRK